MGTEQIERTVPRHRIGAIVTIGIIAVGLAIAYVAWSKGVFKKHEKVAILTWNEDTFWDPTALGANEAARDFGVDLTFIKSKPDEATQSQHIRELLDAGVDGLALSPNNPKAQESIINEAAAKAVVITFDSDAPNTRRRGFVGTDDYAAGQMAAEQVRAAIPDGGKVIVSVGSIEMSNGRDRRQGLIDDLLDRPFRRDRATEPLVGDLKGKNYDVVGTIIDGGDVEKSSKLVAAAINADPDVKCIVGLFSYSGPAILRAVEASGKKGQIKIIGFDESAEEQADVLSGAIYSCVLQDQYACGYETVRALCDQLRGIKQGGPLGPRLTVLPVLVMLPSNITELRDMRVIRRVDTK